MSIRREFLGLDRPALVSAAEYLRDRFRRDRLVDLTGVIVVLPGGRAGRRLLEILVEQAAIQELALMPPRIETVGRLPEQLYRPQRPFASELVQTLVWARTLRESPPAELTALIPQPPAPTDDARWLELGRLLKRHHTELAAEGLDFGDVLRRGAEIEGFEETKRWQSMHALQQAYLRRLDAFELWDIQTARLVAVDQRECQTRHQIVLVGTADMNLGLRQMLDQVADQVTALIFAPTQWADRFDEHGCLVVDAWEQADIEIPSERIRVVGGPGDQAAAVVDCLARYNAAAGDPTGDPASRGVRFRADEITIGAADERLVPQLQRQLSLHGLDSRWGPGRPLSETGPFRLLQALAGYLRRGRFSDLAALVRHRDVHAWLLEQGLRGDWLTQLDAYYSEHLPSQLTEQWLGEEKRHALPRDVHRAIGRLVEPLSGEPRCLADWTDPWLNLLASVFGERVCSRDDAGQRATLLACETLRDLLCEQSSVPRDLSPLVRAADAIQWVLDQASASTVPPPIHAEAIEILGWLELPLDDAPALIVTGLNDGLVPESVNADLFLPNTLRRQLGLLDNARRYARDAYALSALLRSRAELDLIVGRRSAEGDPLLPSRLLFATDAETVARRTLSFIESEPQEPPDRPAAGPRLMTTEGPSREVGTASFTIPKPQPLEQPITELSVTAFRSYLACPYRFYLNHVLRLAPLSDSALELDGGAFGNLLHGVLERFGTCPDRESTDPETIRRIFDHELNRCAEERFGRHARAAVVLQIEQARARLHALAKTQAAWAAEGWRILHVESPDTRLTADFPVDAQSFKLLGRIDRIDVHVETGQFAILDYKSGDAGYEPDRTHRAAGEWIDLQLPLYRHLVGGLHLEGPVRLGYVLLPKDVRKVAFEIAPWSPEELAGADHVARDVIRRLRREEFWPPTDPPPPFSEVFAAICQDGVRERASAEVGMSSPV